MPVVFNEPISFLQRLTEYMEYSYLLERASVCQSPAERMAVSFLRLQTSCFHFLFRLYIPHCFDALIVITMVEDVIFDFDLIGSCINSIWILSTLH